jgi:hypothetical protein
MILSRNIPLNAYAFLSNIQRDFYAQLFSSNYRELLIGETKRRYPGLVEGLADLRHGRTNKGQVRVLADADHIIPTSLWNILIPLVWNLSGTPPPTPDILSNLFWRTVSFNRGSETRGEALDQPWIRQIKNEAKSKTSRQWAQRHVEMFLRTKHDEGVTVDVPVDPGRINEMSRGCDLGDVIEFIQKARQTRPQISSGELVDLVENRFPHIRIESEGKVPRVEMG